MSSIILFTVNTSGDSELENICLTHSSGLSRAVIFSCIIGSLLQALLWDIRTHSSMASMLSSYLFSLEMINSNNSRVEMDGVY